MIMYKYNYIYVLVRSKLRWKEVEDDYVAS